MGSGSSERSCRICSCRSTREWTEEYFLCEYCDTIQLKELPSEVPSMTGLLEKRYSAEHEAVLWREADLTLAELGVDLAGKALHDVGCGNGWFVRLAKCSAFAPTGDEFPSPFLSCGNAEDAIFLWDVLEHALDPIDLVESCCSRLRDSGSLIVQTPLVSEYTKALGSSWRFLSPPYHVHLFSRRSLEIVLGGKWRRETTFGCGLAAGLIPDGARRILSQRLKEKGLGDEIAVVVDFAADS